MECLSKGAVVNYLAGDLSREWHDAAELHLNNCAQCMGLLSELSQQPDEQRAERDADGNLIPTAVEAFLPIETDHGKKNAWLERHYHLCIGDVIDDKYRIDKVLGSGAMGIVVLATNVALRSEVALKFMHPMMAIEPKHANRFIREARAAVQLRNQHITQVFDLGEHPDNGPFIVMEYMKGQDLLEYLKDKAPLPTNEAVELIRQAATGVAMAHAAGIIHRDLKPGNMFITNNNGRRILKVLDFGVSKLSSSESLSMTSTNMVIGSPMYMAPELFESARHASFSSDIWAIGIIFYRMLTGRLPFYAESLPETVAKILFSPPVPLTHWLSDVPSELLQVINVCLERDPNNRFATAQEFLNALAQLPARIRTGSHEPSIAISHLAARPPAQSETSEHTPPIRRRELTRRELTMRLEKPSRTGWIFGAIGALGSAMIFALVLLATSGEPTSSAAKGDWDAGKKDVEPIFDGSNTDSETPETVVSSETVSQTDSTKKTTEPTELGPVILDDTVKQMPHAVADSLRDARSLGTAQAPDAGEEYPDLTTEQPNNPKQTSKEHQRTIKRKKRHKKKKPPSPKPPPTRPEDSLLLP